MAPRKRPDDFYPDEDLADLQHDVVQACQDHKAAHGNYSVPVATWPRIMATAGDFDPASRLERSVIKNGRLGNDAVDEEEEDVRNQVYYSRLIEARVRDKLLEDVNDNIPITTGTASYHRRKALEVRSGLLGEARRHAKMTDEYDAYQKSKKVPFGATLSLKPRGAPDQCVDGGPRQDRTNDRDGGSNSRTKSSSVQARPATNVSPAASTCVVSSRRTQTLQPKTGGASTQSSVPRTDKTLRQQNGLPAKPVSTPTGTSQKQSRPAAKQTSTLKQARNTQPVAGTATSISQEATSTSKINKVITSTADSHQPEKQAKVLPSRKNLGKERARDSTTSKQSAPPLPDDSTKDSNAPTALPRTNKGRYRRDTVDGVTRVEVGSDAEQDDIQENEEDNMQDDGQDYEQQIIDAESELVKASTQGLGERDDDPNSATGTSATKARKNKVPQRICNSHPTVDERYRKHFASFMNNPKSKVALSTVEPKTSATSILDGILSRSDSDDSDTASFQRSIHNEDYEAFRLYRPKKEQTWGLAESLLGLQVEFRSNGHRTQTTLFKSSSWNEVLEEATDIIKAYYIYTEKTQAKLKPSSETGLIRNIRSVVQKAYERHVKGDKDWDEDLPSCSSFLAARCIDRNRLENPTTRSLLVLCGYADWGTEPCLLPSTNRRLLPAEVSHPIDSENLANSTASPQVDPATVACEPTDTVSGPQTVAHHRTDDNSSETGTILHELRQLKESLRQPEAQGTMESMRSNYEVRLGGLRDNIGSLQLEVERLRGNISNVQEENLNLRGLCEDQASDNKRIHAEHKDSLHKYEILEKENDRIRLENDTIRLENEALRKNEDMLRNVYESLGRQVRPTGQGVVRNAAASGLDDSGGRTSAKRVKTEPEQ
ncbi:hypothetical protein HJFPF1_12017 [Paramyrothecium foliicola]|nr:hypothetical protein HJFPF1_12017 [Paramyrothecium foliicola]